MQSSLTPNMPDDTVLKLLFYGAEKISSVSHRVITASESLITPAPFPL